MVSAVSADVSGRGIIMECSLRLPYSTNIPLTRTKPGTICLSENLNVCLIPVLP